MSDKQLSPAAIEANKRYPFTNKTEPNNNAQVVRNIAFVAGAEWQKEQDKDLLQDALLQIQYLHNKFGETGSGNNIISRLEKALGLPY